MIIDSKILTEPRTWRITKINRISPTGVLRATLAQDEFNDNRDYIELNDQGNVIGMWASYYDTNTPLVDFDEPEPQTELNVRLTYAGAKPEIKIGGSYKTFYAKMYNGETEIPIEQPGTWKFFIGNEIADSLVTTIDDGSGKIKVKFDGDLSYIGKVLTVEYTSYNDLSASIEVDIRRL